MELIRGYRNIAPDQRGCVLTIGNFDGVHLGHQALIARAQALGRAQGLPMALMTFEPTPREFFCRDRPAPRISTFRGKVRVLGELGVDRLIVQRFGRALSAMSPETFVREVLVEGLGVRAVVIGDDFRFGHQRGGDLALLQRMGPALGFSAEGMGTISVGVERCSSTALRQALGEADLARAEAMLGHPYAMTGHVRRGLQLARKLGMPTTNIFLHRAPALKLGIYAVRASVGGQHYEGVAALGVRPTLGFTRCLLETHVFGEPGELYGQAMTVQFCRFLRPEEHFDSLDALAAQMQRDKADAAAFFAS
ncbi:MAG TPA: bifunctional riboflavin kinase/FAD synthetase [Solimonas sp.]|nr:bifunctional riboflavin kinase/FAD synthetase [Solimonas sp.]